MNESSFDVAVIGGGAAGLSATLVLGRARRRVVVIDAGAPRNAPAAHMHGYLSRDGMPPVELLAAGRREVRAYGVELLAGEVVAVAPTTGGFEVSTRDRTARARRVLVTTGLTDDVPDVPGVRERWGRDVLHCPYCHGWEVRDQRLAVLGGTPEAVQHALLVRQWSADVAYFSNDTPPDALEREQLLARGIDVVEAPVRRLVVEADALTGVEVAGGVVVPRDAVFVRPAFAPRDGLLTSLGCETQANGWVLTDSTGRTSVPGVWAAGNAANPRAQVITAAGEGSAAAIAINNDLADEDTRLAVRDHRLGRPA